MLWCIENIPRHVWCREWRFLSFEHHILCMTSPNIMIFIVFAEALLSSLGIIWNLLTQHTNVLQEGGTRLRRLAWDRMRDQANMWQRKDNTPKDAGDFMEATQTAFELVKEKMSGDETPHEGLRRAVRTIAVSWPKFSITMCAPMQFAWISQSTSRSPVFPDSRIVNLILSILNTEALATPFTHSYSGKETTAVSYANRLDPILGWFTYWFI